MQSRPSEITQNNISETRSQETQSTHKHGFSRHDGQSDLSPLVQGDGAVPSSSWETGSAAASEQDVEVQAQSADPALAGTSTPPARTRSPVDRIIEHERATTPSPKGNGRKLSFRVVPKPKNSTVRSRALIDFPNGIRPGHLRCNS